jgi:hypothetical protein
MAAFFCEIEKINSREARHFLAVGATRKTTRSGGFH